MRVSKKMEFSIPFNWQEDFLQGIGEFSPSAELYGKLAADIVGGGKHSCQVPGVSRRSLPYFIDQIHRRNLKFNYLLNASCLGDLGSTSGGRKKIMELIDWVAASGVDSFTVTAPFLLGLIKKRYPGMKVNVSVLAGINSVTMAKYWEELGADRLTLLNTDINRNFKIIRSIRNGVRCELQLIANANCLYKCPMNIYHGCLASHSSQTTHPTKGLVIDYCRLTCRYRLLMNPAEIIRSAWIRPEDIGHYEGSGIDSLKLIDRGMTTGAILGVLKAYSGRRYEGNLLDLFPNPVKTIVFQKGRLFHKIRYFFRPFSVNPLTLMKLRHLFSEIFYVRNSSLNGFLDYFLKKADCDSMECATCGYCDSIADKVVAFDPQVRNVMVSRYKQCLDSVVNGEMFYCRR